MAFQTPITISDALERIHKRQYALPAIQREFVWSQEQICALFDSLMRGYPIGAFLFWEVKEKSLRKHNWYEFITRYHQKDDPHCHELTIADRSRGVTAILDGQQRLTALNIGIYGSYAEKLPRLWWNNPYAFPKRNLYLKLTKKADDDESGSEFLFKMMPKKGTRMVPERETAGDPSWFRVRDIRKFQNTREIHRYLQTLNLADHPLAFDHLDRLREVVYSDKVISFYEERDQNVDKVLDIFIRTNSGGTQLSYSDLLMSVAVAAWKGRDAREEIHGLVDDLNEIGGQFQFNKDMVLKAGLLISDLSDIRFKVTNFNRDNMKTVEQKWDLITESLTTAVQLISSFGFSGMNFGNQNAVMIIAYYLSRRSDRSRVLDASSEDRSAIRKWLMTVLVKRGLWASTDALLGRARNAIREHCGAGFHGDAVASAIAGAGSMDFTDEEIEDLADTSYGDWSAYSLLSLLFDHVDTANNVFHLDHVVPRAQATSTSMDRAGLDDDDRKYISERINLLPNLQLLNGRENKNKSARLPRQWIESSDAFADDRSRDSYADLQDLGDWRVLPEDLRGFRAFYDARRQRLVKRLKGLLPYRQSLQESRLPPSG